MMFLKNYYTEFMVLQVMVCVTYSSTILSLIIFNFLSVFKISLPLFEFMNKFHN